MDDLIFELNYQTIRPRRMVRRQRNLRAEPLPDGFPFKSSQVRDSIAKLACHACFAVLVSSTCGAK